MQKAAPVRREHLICIMDTTTTINGECFEDILCDRRKYGDLKWITAKWDSPKYCFYKARSPEELKNDVFNSQRVQQAIEELGKNEASTIEELKKRAQGILLEMGHNQNMLSIRFIGFFLAKVLKRLYSHVFISTNGIEKIRNSVAKHPILLMPTHRSYMDFLLMSFICFHFHIPMPVIAAGLDFLGLKAVRTMLRNAGAFFIRRAFGEDKLYWAIFTEYVQNILRSGESPMEFFVEGTRSRSAKSLNPKLGLLLAAMELYATAQVSDITIVPISITYDRTLEESLYAYELLGIPKPKETTSGLFKARKILAENFGNIYMTVGNPISMREFCRNKIERSIHNLQPRFRSILSPEETEVCSALANRIVKTQQKNLYISAFPLIALILGHDLSVRGQGVPCDYLTEQVLWLKELIEKTGAFVILNDDSSSPWLCQTIELHSNLVQLLPNGIVALLPQNSTDNNVASVALSLALRKDTVAAALPSMFIYHYGNQALQLLSQVAMVSSTVITMEAATEENLFLRYKILREILQKEFVFEPEHSEIEFSLGLRILRGQGLLTHREGVVGQAQNSTDKLLFLANLISPFLTAYKCLWQYILVHSEELLEIPCSSLSRRCQCVIQEELTSGKLQDYRILSLDTLNNGLLTLIALGGAVKETHDSITTISCRKMVLLENLQNLVSFLGENGTVEAIDVNTTFIPMAKL